MTTEVTLTKEETLDVWMNLIREADSQGQELRDQLDYLYDRTVDLLQKLGDLADFIDEQREGELSEA